MDLVGEGEAEGDVDGDGLPDDYELANGLDPDDPDDAQLDPDADGLTSLEVVILSGSLEDEFGLEIDPALADWIVWPLYYVGKLMIATGVVQTLRNKAAKGLQR